MNKILSLVIGLFIGATCIAQIPTKITPDIYRETLLDVTNGTPLDSFYLIIPVGSYNHYALDILSTGASCKAFATLDEAVPDTSEVEWADYNSQLFGVDSLYNDHMLPYQGQYFNPLKIMLKGRYIDATNRFKVILQKSN